MVLATLLLLSGPARVYEPKVGSKERKAIMDATRRVVAPKIGGKIVFKVEWLRSTGTVAFLGSTPQRPDGKRIDWLKTAYAEQVREGSFGGGADALLLKRRGRWVVDQYVIGASDVWYDGMWSRRGFPRALFPSY